MAGKEHHRWRGRHLLLDATHEPELEARAAVHELSEGLPPAAAEQRAHEAYLRGHMVRAAAHHLAGMRSQHTVGNDAESRNHHLYFGVLARTLGFDPQGEPPEEIKRLATDAAQTKMHPFQPHGADAIVLEHLRRQGVGVTKSESEPGEPPLIGVATGDDVDMTHLLEKSAADAGERLLIREGGSLRTVHLVREVEGRRVPLGAWADEGGEAVPLGGAAAPPAVLRAIALRQGHDAARLAGGLRRLGGLIELARSEHPTREMPVLSGVKGAGGVHGEVVTPQVGLRMPEPYVAPKRLGPSTRRPTVRLTPLDAKKAELEKRSKNVREQTRNITPEQATQRRVQYAQNIGLKPKVGFVGGTGDGNAGFPKARGNVLPYGGNFDVTHETAHAMMTPEGMSVGQYQRQLTAHGAPEDDTGEGDELHAQAVHEDNVANQLEHRIDRRAGVGQQFAGTFRQDMNVPQDNQDDEALSRLYEPTEDHPNPFPVGKLGQVPAKGIGEEAAGYAQPFDAGARFDPKGRIQPPEATLHGRVSQGASGVNALRGFAGVQALVRRGR